MNHAMQHTVQFDTRFIRDCFKAMVFLALIGFAMAFANEAMAVTNQGSAGGATAVRTGMNQVIGIIRNTITLISVACVLAGFWFFIMGIVWSIKKSKPDTASQVSGGQIAGGLLGGPALAIAGFLLYQVVTLIGGQTNNVAGGLQF